MRLTTVLATIATVAGIAAATSRENQWNTPKGGFKIHANQATNFTWNASDPDEEIQIRTHKKGDTSAATQETLALAHYPNDGHFSWTPNDKYKKGETYIISNKNDRDDYNEAEVHYE